MIDSRPQRVTAGGVSAGRRWLIFVGVTVALLLGAMDQTIVAATLPSIQADLDAPVEWTTWTMSVSSLGMVVAMPIAGRLADLLGRRITMVIAASIFTAAAIGCGLAQDIGTLVAFRAIQALGGGAILPVSSGVVADVFGRNRDRAIGFFSTILPIGGVLGPVVGGYIVAIASWRDIFFLTAPFGVVVVVMAAILFPSGRGSKEGRLDLPGMMLLVAAILGVMFAVTSLGNPGTSPYDVRVLAPAGAALIAGVLFVWWMRRAAHPFVPLFLLRGHGFGYVNLINIMYGVTAVASTALIPLYAHARFGLTALDSGLLLSARALGMIAFSVLGTFVMRRTGYRPPMMTGYALLAVGTAGLVLVPDGVDAAAWLLAAAALGGVGMGIAVPAANNAAMQLQPTMAAAITGLRGMFRQGGAVFSIAIASSLAARSPDLGEGLATVFLVMVGILVAAIPLVLFVPEHRGGW
ncbi:MAG TPA: MFS transporter [Microbacteriaceae bacterium]|nr:MFS transporter [Microbacteriaceae bacterium]